LSADNRAVNVGDLVTISITEASKASEIANTNTSRDSGVTVGITSLLGLSFPMKAFTNKDVNVDTALEGTVGNVSKGQGKTERQSSFTSYLTARVIRVLPNRNLVIQGRRNMRINNETEIVTLTGIVRPDDIDRNNVVPSTKVADARVMISGAGVVSDKQRVGWGQRIIDHVWPF
jgi:flagellar L-ring protein precursor FlgH